MTTSIPPQGASFDLIERADLAGLGVLLEHGLDPDETLICEQLGMQPCSLLEFACWTSQLPVLDFLARRGAPLDRVRNGRNLMHFAGTAQVVDFLAERGVRIYPPEAAYSPLFPAVQEGRVDVMKALHRHGANPEVFNFTSGDSVMKVAIDCYEPDCVAALLEMGVSAESPMDYDHHQHPALPYCVFKEAPECARVLVEHGANVETSTDQGLTPLMVVMVDHFDHPERRMPLVKLLLEAGANVHHQDHEGLTLAGMMDELRLDGGREECMRMIRARLQCEVLQDTTPLTGPAQARRRI